MTYILIFLAVCSIVGPALMLLPSRRQREQMELRSAARRMGMIVALATIADPEPDPAKYRTLSGKQLPRVIRCVALRRMRKQPLQWQERRQPTWELARPPVPAGSAASAWRWTKGGREALSGALVDILDHQLDALPADVIAVGEERLLLSVCWLERSGQAGLQQIEALMQQLLGAPLTDPEEGEDTG